MRGLSAFSGCGWAYGFTFTLLPPQTLPQICESWLKPDLMQVCKPCHYKAAEPFKLHPMFMPYIYEYERFEHLLRLWMGIWLHTHTVTTTYTSPDLWELGEIPPDASVQTMPLCFDWGCRIFQTASHVHVIHIRGVWAPSQVVDGHMAWHSHHYHHSMDQFIEAEELCWVVLHSYLELRWSYGKTLQGLHRTHIPPYSHWSVYSGNKYFLHSACKGLLWNMEQSGGFARDLFVVGLSKHLPVYPPYIEEQKNNMESMILFTVPKKKIKHYGTTS